MAVFFDFGVIACRMAWLLATCITSTFSTFGSTTLPFLRELFSASTSYIILRTSQSFFSVSISATPLLDTLPSAGLLLAPLSALPPSRICGCDKLTSLPPFRPLPTTFPVPSLLRKRMGGVTSPPPFTPRGLMEPVAAPID